MPLILRRNTDRNSSNFYTEQALDNNFVFLESAIQQESTIRENADADLQEKIDRIKQISNYENTILFLDFESPFLGRNKGCLPINGDVTMVNYRTSYSNSGLLPQTLQECIDNSSLYGTRSWCGGIASYYDSQVDWSLFTEEFIFKFNFEPGTHYKETFFGIQPVLISSWQPGMKRTRIGLAFFNNNWWVAGTEGNKESYDEEYYNVTNIMPPVAKDTWYHYAYQKISDTEFNIFFNGVKLGQWSTIEGPGVGSLGIKPLGTKQSYRTEAENQGLDYSLRKLISVDQYRLTAQVLYNDNFTPSKFE